MGVVGNLLRHSDEIPPVVKLKVAAMQAQRAIPEDANLAFCYQMLTRVSRSFSIVIQQLRVEFRDAKSTWQFPQRSSSLYSRRFTSISMTPPGNSLVSKSDCGNNRPYGKWHDKVYRV